MHIQAELLWEKTLETLGEGNYLEYRIPGIVVTPKGTLLCCYEGRMSTRDDWAQIDTVVCRSDDDGETWTKTPFTLPADMGGQASDTVNNPTLIIDEDRVHLIFHQNYVRAFHTESLDDGRTWSRPAEITSAFREFDAEWTVCATGPGHGLRTRTGRLVAPIWIANGKRIDDRRIEHQPSRAGAIYSDDHGCTWHAGGLIEGVYNANETCIAELADGRLLFNFRNCEPDFHRRLAISEDSGVSFGAAWLSEALPDPMCFGGMTALPGGIAAFVNCVSGAANPDRPNARIHTTVKVSEDAGATWEVLTSVEDMGGYADIAAHENAVYVLYEVGGEKGCIAKLKLKKYALTL